MTTGIKGIATLGWISFFSLLCTGCSGLPVLAGIFGGVAVTTRFGLSTGIVSGVMLTAFALRRRRARRQQACALPAVPPALTAEPAAVRRPSPGAPAPP